jgi:chemotaxis protein MotB
MKKIIVLLISSIFISSCISKKEYAALQTKHNKTKDELLAVKNSLTKCVIDNEKCDADVANLNNIIADLKNDKKKTLEYVDNLTVLTQGATDNIKETLAQLSKKDKYINRIRAAATKKRFFKFSCSLQLEKRVTRWY